MVKKIFILCLLILAIQKSYGQPPLFGFLAGDAEPCPEIDVSYGVNSTCLTGVTYSWSVVGALSYVQISGGRGVSVKWPNNNSSKSVSVSVGGSGTCPSQYYSMNVTLRNVVPAVISPTSLEVGNVKLCAGNNLEIKANMPSNPNADADIYNDVSYAWSYSKDGAPSINLTTTSVNTHTFPIPAAWSGSSIVFSVYTYNQRCSNFTSPVISASAETIMALPPIPSFGVCLDGNKATVYLKEVTGSTLYSSYYINIFPIASTGGITAGGIIAQDVDVNPTLNNNLSVQFYYDYIPPSGSVGPVDPGHVINPADGCKVDAVIPGSPSTDHTIGFTSAANCNAGLSVSGVSGGLSPYTVSIDGTYQSEAVFTFNSLSSGAKLVNVKDKFGCVGTGSNVNTYLSVSLPAPTITPDCPGVQTNGTITLAGSGGKTPYSYFITGVNGDVYQPSGVFTGLGEGTYTVNVKDSNGSGCTYSTTATIGNSAVLTLGTITPGKPLCYGEASGTLTVSASGGQGTTHYSIDNGSNYQDANLFSGLPSGSYTVLIRDDNNCTQTSSAGPIVDPDPITVSLANILTTPQSCVEKIDGSISILATGGTGARQYALEDVLTSYKPEGSPTTLFSSLASNTYTVYIKDGNGCKVSNTGIFVASSPVLGGTLGESTPISCNNAGDGVLSANITGGTGAGTYSYAWTPAGNTSGNQKTNIIPGTYSVTVTDGKGCTYSTSKLVGQPGVLSLSNTIKLYSTFGISCTGKSDGAIDLTVSGGTFPFTFDWTNTLAGINPSDVEDPGSLKAGTYSVLVKDAHNCTTTLNNIIVNEPTPLTVILGNKTNINCNNGSDGSIVVTPGGGASNYLYSLDSVLWQPSPSFSGLEAGSYRVRLIDDNDCVIALPINLTEPADLVVSLAQPVTNTVCGQANGSAQVSAVGGVATYSYEWYNDLLNKVGTSALINNLAAGSYKAIAIDSHSCKDTLAVNISNSNGPVITVVDKTNLTCFNSNDGSIIISTAQGQAPYTTSWLINGLSSSVHTNTIDHLPSGSHTARVSDVDGCLDFETIEISSPLAISVSETLKSPTCVGFQDGEIKLISSGGNPGGYVYTWNNGSNGSTLSSLKEGTYQVHITDVKNCSLDHAVVLKDPAPVIINLGEDRTICVGQQVKLSPGLIGTYAWTSSTGFTSSSADVILTAPGTYKLSYRNEKNCIGEDELKIVTSTDLLKADFLMVAEAHAGDTVVMIDISWPLPGNIRWDFPPGVTTVNSDGPFAEVVFVDPGSYAVTLHANLGECIDDYVKLIEILEGKVNEGGRVSTNNHFIRHVEASPNPVNDVMHVVVELQESSGLQAAIVNMDGSRIVYSYAAEGSDHYAWDIVLPNVSVGMYYLIIKSKDEIKVLRIIKI